MLARVQDAVGMTKQFLAGILADLTELVIDVCNDALAVSNRNNKDIIHYIRPEVGIFMCKGAEPVIMRCGHSVTSDTDRKT